LRRQQVSSRLRDVAAIELLINDVCDNFNARSVYPQVIVERAAGSMEVEFESICGVVREDA
jgi:hypothetical protein